ncbi:peptidoglycan DD-metalloendopeptidase family protein [Panacibacter ginsenosidivorans]|uniref:Peptidoglycan DD-metalloendopeptidase family protein n=1 Tax=Panacibacter ginsenosidivorans TaxID=1813871 RepID=A0A5B8VC19_9BACT|nr:peptidoglycan DD-metalloendopeptidase family protein [Panacibacter ginsenosidivorans]QEC67818.1 peptidoglycan DD-metalloendopeptidase family protein [Panacibacter ginsenosidivorans]
MIANLLRKFSSIYKKVVPFNAATDKLLRIDFTASNKILTGEIFEHTEKFTAYIATQLLNADAVYGIGGYNESRTVYSRSKHFDSADGTEPRRVHLGIDIWGAAGTPVFAPIGGMVHSFAYNDHFGDYGATIILLHQLDGMPFYTLYGHLSLKDISVLKEGQYINIGEEFGHFGLPEENGHWPPHLHFQVIEDMQLHKGDYPGVCKFSEREKYLANCPDPDLMLNMMQHAKQQS